MANPYIYSVSADMPGGAVNEEKLHAEIVASAIATTLDSVRADMNVLTITFTGDLSAGDKTILDGDIIGPAGGLLAAHDNTATQMGNALRYSRNSNQSIANAAVVIIDFNTHDFGDDAGDVTTGATWKYTVPVAGRYQVNAQITVDEGVWASGEEVSGRLTRNGTVEYIKIKEFEATHTGDFTLDMSGLFNCEVGDTLNFEIWQTSGAAVNLVGWDAVSWRMRNRISIVKVADAL